MPTSIPGAPQGARSIRRRTSSGITVHREQHRTVRFGAGVADVQIGKADDQRRIVDLVGHVLEQRFQIRPAAAARIEFDLVAGAVRIDSRDPRVPVDHDRFVDHAIVERGLRFVPDALQRNRIAEDRPAGIDQELALTMVVAAVAGVLVIGTLVAGAIVAIIRGVVALVWLRLW